MTESPTTVPTPNLVQAFSADYALVVLCCLLIVVIVVATALLYQRRKLFPIRGRGVKGVVAMNFLIVGLLINWALIVSPDWPCCIYLMLNTVGYCGAVILYTGRAAILLFKYTISDVLSTHNAQEVLSTHQQQQLQEEISNNFYVKNRRWIKTKPITLIGLINFGVIVLTAPALKYTLDLNCEDGCTVVESDPSNHDTLLTFNAISLAFFVLYAAVGLFIGFKMRSFEVDAFYMKKELKLVTLIILVTIVGYGLPHMLLDENSLVLMKRYRAGSFIYFITVLFVFFCSCALPLYQSFIFQKNAAKLQASGTQINMTFEDVLNNPSYAAVLLKYMKSEFSTENLLYWLAVKELRSHIEPTTSSTKQSSDKKRSSRAFSDASSLDSSPSSLDSSPNVDAISVLLRNCYRSFLAPKAPFPVNISAEIRDEVFAAFAEFSGQHVVDEGKAEKSSHIQMMTRDQWRSKRSWSSGSRHRCSSKSSITEPEKEVTLESLTAMLQTMVVAQSAVFRMMRTDTYIRFKSSPGFEEIKEMEARRQILPKSFVSDSSKASIRRESGLGSKKCGDGKRDWLIHKMDEIADVTKVSNLGIEQQTRAERSKSEEEKKM